MEMMMKPMMMNSHYQYFHLNCKYFFAEHSDHVMEICGCQSDDDDDDDFEFLDCRSLNCDEEEDE